MWLSKLYEWWELWVTRVCNLVTCDLPWQRDNHFVNNDGYKTKTMLKLLIILLEHIKETVMDLLSQQRHSIVSSYPLDISFVFTIAIVIRSFYGSIQHHGRLGHFESGLRFVIFSSISSNLSMIHMSLAGLISRLLQRWLLRKNLS